MPRVRERRWPASQQHHNSIATASTRPAKGGSGNDAVTVEDLKMAMRGNTTGDMFDKPGNEQLSEGAWLLRGFASSIMGEVTALIDQVAGQAPFRQMTTPGGYPMSVAVTSCGSVGWISDKQGYRYSSTDPETGRPWPTMPPALFSLATRAATQAGYPGFAPDSCLINEYRPGAAMGLHQDKDEQDMSMPIVSVSVGLPATFLWGGTQRSAPLRKVVLHHGDIVVWGGPARLVYHGIERLTSGPGYRTRRNLTFRKAS